MTIFRMLSVLAAGLGALLIAGSADGQVSAGASIEATDFAFRASGGGAPNVTIAAGANVDFTYAIGNSFHNVVFTGMQPRVCGVSAGPASSNMAPLPNAPAGPIWEGGCTFDTPGSYPFVCGLHGGMTGSVTVLAAGTAPPPPPPPPPAATGPAASKLTVSLRQRGTSVRGAVTVRSAGSRLLARAFARRGALTGGRSAVLVAVGRQLRASVASGRTTFSVPLNAAARRALRRNGRLAITLRLTVTPPSGASFTATRAVILRPS